MIRPERTVELFSRGIELIRRIREMWRNAESLPRGDWSNELCGYPKNRTIKLWIEAILADFDLTVEEWHYWCREILK